jgi:hypothetical protein
MRARWARCVAALSLTSIAWTLTLSAGHGLMQFFARAGVPAGAFDHELERLGCIERTVASLTTSGERVRLAVDDDPYLRQRVVELIYPRIDLVRDRDAPLLTVTQPADPASATHCGDLRITFSRRANGS